MGTANRLPLRPALLADAAWWGTLAAARDLGSRGVPVTLASERWLAPARWSRHVTRTVRYPGTADPGRLLEWLLDFGRRWPGHVLYPTSDEVAWVVAANQEALARDFLLFTPPVDALVALLDKLQLERCARAVGLDTLQTWCPADGRELACVAQEARFPVYVKPRTQVFAASHAKGQRASDAAELTAVWNYWRDCGRYPREVAEAIPDVALPVIQESLPRTERIFTVDGFVDDTGALRGVLGCVKLLQRPRGSGPGIYFEEAKVPPEIAAGLGRLFRSTGFRGVFDAEFIEEGGRRLLIDVNPRFYNHMAFEIERGLPLPWLAYCAAFGLPDRRSVGRPIGRRVPESYVHRVPVGLMAAVHTLTGAIAREDRDRWRRCTRPGVCRTDPALQKGDPWPAVAELACELVAATRHPRAWLRGLATRPGWVPGRPAVPAAQLSPSSRISRAAGS